MKKILNLLGIISILSITNACFASGVGFIEMNYISKHYPLAQKYSASIRARAEAIQAYAQKKDNEIARIKNKDKKQRAKKEAVNQIQMKQKELAHLKAQYESDLMMRIQDACEKVRIKRKLDIIVKEEARMTGGINCSIEVLNILNSNIGQIQQ